MKTTDKLLELLLNDQAEWDKKYSLKETVDSGIRAIDLLLLFAQFSNNKDFKAMMRNRLPSNTKTDIFITTLRFLGLAHRKSVLKLINQEATNRKSYSDIFEDIFNKSVSYYSAGGLSKDFDEMLSAVCALYIKYLNEYGLQVLSWVDQRREELGASSKAKIKKNGNDK